jgi:hypothetical protein
MRPTRKGKWTAKKGKAPSKPVMGKTRKVSWTAKCVMRTTKPVERTARNA